MVGFSAVEACHRGVELADHAPLRFSCSCFFLGQALLCSGTGWPPSARGGGGCSSWFCSSCFSLGRALLCSGTGLAVRRASPWLLSCSSSPLLGTSTPVLGDWLAAERRLVVAVSFRFLGFFFLGRALLCSGMGIGCSHGCRLGYCQLLLPRLVLLWD